MSAVFNSRNLLSIVKKKGHADFRFRKCRIYAGEYRDISDAQGIGSFLEEMVAEPCGNSNIEPQSSRQQNT